MGKKKKREVTINRLAASLSVSRRDFSEAKRELESIKTAFYEERKDKLRYQGEEEHVREVIKKVREELGEERGKHRQVWESINEILYDSGAMQHITGWYWWKKRSKPVYIDGISEDGLTGYDTMMLESRPLGSVTETFQVQDLIRIDVNLEDLED